MAAATFRANSGGAQYTSSTTGTWNADSSYTGSSTTYSNTNTIANTADPKLYQSERWGSSFGYSVPVANGSYTLNLYFAEIFYTSTGKRVFNVAAQGKTVLSNFDIVAAAGGANRAVVKSIPVTVTNGVLSVNLTSVVGDAKISAVELVAVASTPPVTTSSASFRANSGGAQYTSSTTGTWKADSSYTGNGWGYSNSNTIANTADQKLYQSERTGSSFGYSIPLVNGSYTLNLYFAEIFYSSTGQRVFNVAAQGKTVLGNFDIVAAAGGANRAIVKSIPVTVTNGVLSVNLTGVVASPKISAIEVVGAGSAPPPPPPVPTPVTVTLSPIANSSAVSGVIYQQATTSSPVDSVLFYVDGSLVNTATTSPYYLGGTTNGQPNGYSTASLSPGLHTLQAIATVGSTTYASSTLSFTVAPPSPTGSLYPIPFSSQYIGPSRSVTQTTSQVMDAVGAPGSPSNPNLSNWSPVTWASPQAASNFTNQMVAWYLANGIQPTINANDTRRVQVYSGVTYGPSYAPRDGIDKDAADNKLLPNESDWPHLRVPSSAFGYGGNPMPYPVMPATAAGQPGWWYYVGSASEPLRDVWNHTLSYGNTTQQFTSVYGLVGKIRYTIPSNYVPVYRQSGDNAAIIAGPQSNGVGAMTELYHALEGGGSYAGTIGTQYNNGLQSYPYKLEDGSSSASKEKYAAKLITSQDAAKVASGEIKFFDHPIGFAVYQHFFAVVPASQSRDMGMGSKASTGWGWLPYGGRVRLMLSDDEIDALTSNLMARAIAKTFNRYGGVAMDGTGWDQQQVSIRASVLTSELTPFGGESAVNSELNNLFNTSQVKQNWALVIPPMWPTK
ncbi:MAG: malectin [Anaerolineae bacterium]|nr:malectin [Gloeobacterales cyanobacterium ES-bin-313]